MDREANVEIDYVEAPAEATGLPDGAFDVVSAGQCWHWFDRPAAANEARRVLRPGGTIVICHFDWLPLPGNVVEATEALILEHNPSWRGAGGFGMYPPWTRDVYEAGFREIQTFSFDIDVPYSHEAWCGRIRASAGVAASLPPEEVARFDEHHATMLKEQFPADPLSVPHRVWALIAEAPNP
jgi:SAM-dependent methyltransferase